MKRVKRTCLLLLFVMHQSSGQEITPSMLLCEGKYSNYPMKLIEITLSSGRIRLEKNAVYIQGIPGFGGQGEEKYNLLSINPGTIRFEHSTDLRYLGSLNRLNGEFFLEKRRDDAPDRMEQVAYGICKVKERLF